MYTNPKTLPKLDLGRRELSLKSYRRRADAASMAQPLPRQSASMRVSPRHPASFLPDPVGYVCTDLGYGKDVENVGNRIHT